MHYRAVTVLTLLLVNLAYPIAALAAPPVISGRAALLMDGTTGQVLWHYRGAETNYPASTTKVLTGLVALDRGKLDQVITVSPNVTTVQGWDSSSCYLRPGEQQKLEALLMGLMLSSGNDCAVAIAEGLTGGNPAQFMQWMNEKAESLGAGRSNFVNSSGLHEPDHYTSAHDLALIFKAAIENPVLLRIMGTKSFTMPGHEQDGEHWNHNRLLFTYDGNIGGKTGFTEEAGSTLVSATRRDDTLLIGVVMGTRMAGETYQDMTALFDYGFADFEKSELVAAGEAAGGVPVLRGMEETVTAVTKQNFEILVSRAPVHTHTIERVAELDPEVAAPVQAGQRLGALVLKQDGRTLGTVELVASGAVGMKITSWDKAGPYVQRAGLAVTESLKWMLHILVGIFAFRTVVLFIRRRLLRKGRRPATPRRNPGVLKVYRTKDR